MNKKEIISYLIMGILTTLVNLIVYILLTKVGNIDFKIATTFAWLVSVVFAFITNKSYVFKSSYENSSKVMKEIGLFFSARIISYFIDIISMVVLVTYIMMSDTISKLIANVIVIVLNYFLSKFIIFRKNDI